jgi:GNAT superfamily N-acetyltransferase
MDVIEDVIQVVRARSEQVSQIEALWRAIARESEPGDKGAPSREVRGLHTSLRGYDFLATDSFWLLLGQVDNRPVAYLTAVRIPKPDARLGVLYIDELYVLTAFRRRGIGSALVGQACHIARELGLWRVRLNADQHDPGVVAFYEANGFTHSGDGFFQKRVP